MSTEQQQLGNQFQRRPGGELPPRTGLIGSVLDEYERAAAQILLALAQVPEHQYEEPHALAEGRLVTYRDIAEHVVDVAYTIADLFEDNMDDLDRGRRVHDEARVESPTMLGDALGRAIRHTEYILAPLHGAGPEELKTMTIHAHWGVAYNGEQLLEHAIVHLLRHRQFLLRWLAEDQT